jgi:hypothetical protein
VRLRKDAPVLLPPDYITYLASSNNGKGDLGVQPGWIQVWSAKPADYERTLTVSSAAIRRES